MIPEAPESRARLIIQLSSEGIRMIGLIPRLVMVLQSYRGCHQYNASIGRGERLRARTYVVVIRIGDLAVFGVDQQPVEARDRGDRLSQERPTHAIENTNPKSSIHRRARL